MRLTPPTIRFRVDGLHDCEAWHAALVSKYYEPVYGDLGLHYPKRYPFFNSDVCEPARPRFRVMEDFSMQVRAPNPVFGRHLV